MLRAISFALILLFPLVTIAQDATTVPAMPAKQLRKLLKASEQSGNPVTLIETDGTHLHGNVTRIDADAILFIVTYGTPASRIPLNTIVGIEQPPTKHRKIAAGILVAIIAAAGTAVVVTLVELHKANNPPNP